VTLQTRVLGVQTVTVAFLVMAVACGGGSPTSPGGGGGGGGGGSVVVGSTGAVGTVGATITIGANSTVSPSQVTIAVGQSVTFTNNGGRNFDMSSDPHPTHTSCPSIANVGVLVPGQSKTSFGFAGAGTCGFHDHNTPEAAGLQGRIVIQ
jgi:plastocyanin